MENKKLSAQEVLSNFRRREILDATYKVIAEQGFQALTIDKVAEKAGISKGTIYTYFDGKASLIKEMFIEITAEFISRIEAVTEKDGDITKGIYQIGEEFDKFYDEYREFIIYIHQMGEPEFSALQELKTGETRCGFGQLLNKLSEFIQKGIDRKELLQGDAKLYAVNIFSLFDGIIHAEVVFPDFNLEVNGEIIIDHFLNGIKA